MKGDLHVQKAAIPLLSSWQNFYVIVGSASVGLISLMFVVLSLIASRNKRKSSEVTGVFATPTVVHLCAAFLIAAIFNAPWPELWYVDLALGICGLAGVLYGLVIFWRALRQSKYQPELEDWIWHIILPFLSYMALFGASLVIPANAVLALFIVGAAAVLFLFIGVHNAWDSVTYMIFVIEARQTQKEQEQKAEELSSL